MNKINLYDKVIPKNSEVVIKLDTNVPSGVEATAVQEPDEGYKFSISYFTLVVPDEVEANIIVTTEKGSFPLFSSNLMSGTYTVDSSDFSELNYLDSFALYVKTTTTTSQERDAILMYGGKQVVPYL